MWQRKFAKCIRFEWVTLKEKQCSLLCEIEMIFLWPQSSYFSDTQRTHTHTHARTHTHTYIYIYIWMVIKMCWLRRNIKEYENRVVWQFGLWLIHHLHNLTPLSCNRLGSQCTNPRRVYNGRKTCKQKGVIEVNREGLCVSFCKMTIFGVLTFAT